MSLMFSDNEALEYLIFKNWQFIVYSNPILLATIFHCF